jgi:hypothetical protein
MINYPQHIQSAPWKLQGEGIIIVYNFERDWVLANGFLSEDQKSNFRGGLGFVMMVNYKSSPVGPYHELLFIPGKFGSKNRYSITKIYVDTNTSKDNGRYNWGIPKETKPFIWQKQDKTQTIGVGEEEDPVLFCKISSGGFKFPATTKVFPIKLQQKLDGTNFLTNPSGTGWAKLAKIEMLKVNAKHFPDITRQNPLFVLKVDPFTMNFPIPETS